MNGKSTLGNDLVEARDWEGKFAKVFKTSNGVQSVDSGSKTVKVNPHFLPPNVTMEIQDGDGFGGVGKKVADVIEENLTELKNAPAVLLVVANAGRSPVTLINYLQLLKEL
ncbi:hypothetical protein H9P43_009362 [Blastocladiella emersonii ATCC 22665]|nr:hypothetical protein H9P43_009362 [Blastocladiella emersonii ATCC 22665]